MTNEKLDQGWKHLQGDFKIYKHIGSGTFGQVVHAKHRATGTHCAIKLVRTELKTKEECRNLLRELTILRQLTQMKTNNFVTKIYDVRLLAEEQTSLKGIEGFFLIMEYVPNDIKGMMNKLQPG
jgi:serine/threonine protein kinase